MSILTGGGRVNPSSRISPIGSRIDCASARRMPLCTCVGFNPQCVVLCYCCVVLKFVLFCVGVGGWLYYCCVGLGADDVDGALLGCLLCVELCCVKYVVLWNGMMV